MKISKKWTKWLDISSFYTSVPKIMIICYTVLEIWHVTDVIVLFHFGQFAHSTPLTAQKMKISKKWKEHLKISSFYTIVPKLMIICYTVPEKWYVTDVIVIFHFGLFFVLLMKKCLEISSFYTCVPKIMIWWCMVPEIWCATDGRTDKQTDGWQKWHVEVGAPPKKRKIKRFLYFYDYTIIQPSWI